MSAFSRSPLPAAPSQAKRPVPLSPAAPPSDPLTAFASEEEPPAAPVSRMTYWRQTTARRFRRLTGMQVAVIVLALLALGQGLWIARPLFPGVGATGAGRLAASTVPDSPTVPRGAAEPAAAPTTGSLEVTTEPSGAQVWVDGVARGAAPIAIADLAAGSHQVRIAGPHDTVTRDVLVEAGVASSLVIALSGPGAFASGWLAVESPVSVQLRERGTPVGTTDMPRIMLAAGRHELELVNEALGYRSKQVVTIAAGRTTTLALRVPNGTLHANALPWANVWVDGQPVGETPLANLMLPIGRHDLLFRHPELGEMRTDVTVTVGVPARVGVDLRKER